MVAQIDTHYVRVRPSRLWSRLVSYALFEGRPLTTRGRWINPLIFAHFAVEKRLPQLKKVPAPVFILGTGRSGTTILGIVLSMHRDVGFLNEPKALWHALRSDEDLIGSYTRIPARYRLGAQDADPDLIRNAHRLYGAYLRASGCSRVVDKYPELIFRVPFVKAIFPDARFLFLSRNGWNTCTSINQWSAHQGQTVAGQTHDWWGVNRRKWRLLIDQIVPEHPDLAAHGAYLKSLDDHRLMAAVEWTVTMREGLDLMRSHPGDVLHVPYEALCAAPRDTLSRIADFAGLAEDEIFLNYGEGVLAPSTSKPPFDLPDFLRDPFMTTQKTLTSILENGSAA